MLIIAVGCLDCRGELVAVGTLAELRAQAEQQHSLEEIFLTLTETENG